VTLDDVRKLLKDELRAAIAERALESVDKAEEGAAKAKETGRSPLELARGAADVVEPPTGVENDPLKGRGLGFIRQVRAAVVAKLEDVAPAQVAERWFKEGARHYGPVIERLQAHRRGLSEGNFSAGGAFLTPEQGEFIALLYPKTIAYLLGAVDLEIARSMDFGKMTSGVTASYVNETALVVPSQPGFGALRATTKKVMSLAIFSNELLRNPSVTVDLKVRDEMLKRIALKRDLSYFRGTGAETQPKGILNWIRSANKVSQTGTTLATAFADYVSLIQLVDGTDGNLDAAKWAMHPRTRWALAKLLDGNGNAVLGQMLAQGNLFGFPFATTSQIPTNLGGGTNESEVYFGDFSDTYLVRDSTTPLTVELFQNAAVHDGTSVISGISSDQSALRAMEAHDVLAQHDSTIAVLQAVTLS
jgi:HK97 family phage major capsid protein